MPYSKEVFEAACARLEERRQAAEAENSLIKRQLYEKIPRLAQIEKELAQTGIDAVKDIIASGSAREKIERLKKKNLGLQEERAQLLQANGYPAEILAVNYYCGKCADTGYDGDRTCSCLRALLKEEACRRANSGSPLPLFKFSDFDLNYYPETPLKGSDLTIRKYMGKVFAFCKNYALTFNGRKQSILLLGNTGLGKTHLALAVANCVIGQGFGVIYDTAQNIFMKMEEEYFGRSEKKFTGAVYDCDLLIIDELPDFVSPFALSTLYNIINTRMLAQKPVIVSTNLTEKELSDRYGQRIFSRLIGDYILLKFFGSDIRQQKLNQKAPGI